MTPIPEGPIKAEVKVLDIPLKRLLKLKDLMNTETGRKMAGERHRFMRQFLDQFYGEWDGTR